MSSRVDHFGPDPAAVGGMSAVLRVVCEEGIGADRVFCHPTWTPGGGRRNALLAARAARSVAGLPAGGIVHVHLSERGSFVREGGLARLAHRRGLTTVATIHGADFLAFARRRGGLVRAVLGAADGVTCVAPDVLAFLREAVPVTPTALIPNPVAEDSEPAPADQTGELVLFAGEVGTRKGADVLAEAWARVARQRPSARCLVVGPPTSLRLPGVERLELRPEAAPAAVRGLIREARVVALPSRAEGMPVVLTEAMASARPFVATPVGGVPELATGGLLVPVGDPEALAAALLELLADPARARSLGDRGRELFLATRSAGAVDAELRAFYSACRTSRRAEQPAERAQVP